MADGDGGLQHVRAGSFRSSDLIADLEERRRRVERVLPQVCEVAEAIIAATPEIED